MRRHELEHVLRAAKGITDEIEFVVIGSQAILAQIPDPPRLLTYSNEVDFYPLHAPEKADLIDGVIGELSRFHETYGYYAHGVAPETATLALKWREWAVTLETPLMEGAIGHCLHPVDVAYSKLAAGREKDFAFIRELIRCELIKAGTLAGLCAFLFADLSAQELPNFFTSMMSSRQGETRKCQRERTGTFSPM